MSSQRKLLAVLLALAAGLALLLVNALRTPPVPDGTELVRQKAVPPPKPQPSEPTESTEGRSSLASAAHPGPARVEKPARTPGPPVKIVGRIGDERGQGLAAVSVLVYDSRGEQHQPEVLRTDWYECTIHERGRTLVVAMREESCTAEIPFEVLEPDVERHIDLVLPARPLLRLHVRDLAGKPLPRFAKDQPLRARLRAVASIEELPAELPAHMVQSLSGNARADRLGWGTFEPEVLLNTLSTRAGMHLPGAARGDNRNRRGLPGVIAREFQRVPAEIDDEKFEHAIAQVRTQFKRRLESEGRVDPDDPARLFLAALGYIGDDGSVIEGESPLRDMVGTLKLARPLPLRVSLLAGQRVLESREPVPGTEDLAFKIDLERIAESYVHVYLFASDSKTGARLPGVRANLHVDPLPGGLEDPPDFAGSIATGYAGRAAPPRMGAAQGWRFPEGDVTTDLDGRADFQGALAGWCRMTLEAEGHVPVVKWVCVERAPECYLGYFELAPLATSRLSVVDPEGAPVCASFEVRPLLHAKDREGTLETWKFDSDVAGALVLKGVGRQQLLLRSADTHWALTPVVLDNALDFVDDSALQVTAAQHVLVHLPASLPWNAIVQVVQGLCQPLYEDAFGGKTLVDLWVGDGTYTLRVFEGFTALLTMKFTMAGEPLLVELAR
jgi:hypothetical protein